MNKLTPIFIAGSLAISAGLVIAQSQMIKNDPMQDHDMHEMEMSGVDTPAAGKPYTKTGTGPDGSIRRA